MIQLSREGKILFSLPAMSVLLDEDPRKKPLERPLVSGHVCPNCGVIVQAVYNTDKRVEDLTKEFFNLERRMEPSQFAVPTPRHEVQPKYRSYLFDTTPRSEMLVEVYHADLAVPNGKGRCPYTRMVYRPGPFDLRHYLLGVCRIVNTKEWYLAGNDEWRKLTEGLLGNDEERCMANAQRLFDYFRQEQYNVPKRIRVAQDVTGKGPPVWLISKQDWSYYAMNLGIERCIRTQGVAA